MEYAINGLVPDGKDDSAESMLFQTWIDELNILVEKESGISDPNKRKQQRSFLVQSSYRICFDLGSYDSLVWILDPLPKKCTKAKKQMFEAADLEIGFLKEQYYNPFRESFQRTMLELQKRLGNVNFNSILAGFDRYVVQFDLLPLYRGLFHLTPTSSKITEQKKNPKRVRMGLIKNKSITSLNDADDENDENAAIQGNNAIAPSVNVAKAVPIAFPSTAPMNQVVNTEDTINNGGINNNNNAANSELNQSRKKARLVLPDDVPSAVPRNQVSVPNDVPSAVPRNQVSVPKDVPSAVPRNQVSVPKDVPSAVPRNPVVANTEDTTSTVRNADDVIMANTEDTINNNNNISINNDDADETDTAIITVVGMNGIGFNVTDLDTACSKISESKSTTDNFELYGSVLFQVHCALSYLTDKVETATAQMLKSFIRSEQQNGRAAGALTTFSQRIIAFLYRLSKLN
jgi:hypothetical protein